MGLKDYLVSVNYLTIFITIVNIVIQAQERRSFIE